MTAVPTVTLRTVTREVRSSIAEIGSAANNGARAMVARIRAGSSPIMRGSGPVERTGSEDDAEDGRREISNVIGESPRKGDNPNPSHRKCRAHDRDPRPLVLFQLLAFEPTCRNRDQCFTIQGDTGASMSR